LKTLIAVLCLLVSTLASGQVPPGYNTTETTGTLTVNLTVMAVTPGTITLEGNCTDTTYSCVSWQVYLNDTLAYDSHTNTGTFTQVGLASGTQYRFAIKAWNSKSPQTTALITDQNFTTLSSTNNYYVAPYGSDSSNGQSNAPFATIQKAANVATAGYTVWVFPGTYSTTSSITTPNSATSTQPITFLSVQQFGAKVRSTGVVQIWQVSKSYVNIYGFDIAPTDSTANEGIIGSSGAAHNNYVGNTIHDMNGTTICNMGSGAGIDTDGSGHTSSGYINIIGNVVYNIGTPAQCTVGQGIYVASPGGTIANNVSYHNGAYGIIFNHNVPGPNTVANNTIFNNGLGGIWVGAAYNSVVQQNTVVANNVIYDNEASGVSGYGIRAGGSTDSTDSYLNNIIYGQTHATSGLVGTISGNIYSDPLLVDPTGSFWTGNYALQSSSPGVDAGTNTSLVPYDFYGSTRPTSGNSYPDIGFTENGTPQGWPYSQP
jgi:parallel beta-helix repeat protein